jgi:hypothetical protein
VARVGNGVRPIAGRGYFVPDHLQSAERKRTVKCGGSSGRKVDDEVAFVWERLQQPHDIALERGARSKRRRTRCKLYRPVAIDAIGYGILLAFAGDGWPCDHQFSAAIAAVMESCIEESEPREKVVAATIGL